VGEECGGARRSVARHPRRMAAVWRGGRAQQWPHCCLPLAWVREGQDLRQGGGREGAEWQSSHWARLRSPGEKGQAASSPLPPPLGTLVAHVPWPARPWEDAWTGGCPGCSRMPGDGCCGGCSRPPQVSAGSGWHGGDTRARQGPAGDAGGLGARAAGCALLQCSSSSRRTWGGRACST